MQGQFSDLISTDYRNYYTILPNGIIKNNITLRSYQYHHRMHACCKLRSSAKLKNFWQPLPREMLFTIVKLTKLDKFKSAGKLR